MANNAETEFTLLLYNCTHVFLWTYVNQCASNPCQNDGTCVDIINSYKCKCAIEYTGTSCEIGKKRVYLIIYLTLTIQLILRYYVTNTSMG